MNKQTEVMKCDLSFFSHQLIIGKSFPQFFSFTLDGANLYLTPAKKILRYKIRRETHVPVFGYNQRNQDFIKFISDRILHFYKKETGASFFWSIA